MVKYRKTKKRLFSKLKKNGRKKRISYKKIDQEKIDQENIKK